MNDLNKTVNIGIFAHVDAGKTTLTEQMLYHAGILRNAGSVDGGNTRSDYTEEERKRGISVFSSSVQFSYNETDINIVDTPGHSDFFSEVERTIRVVDCAVLIISAIEGVQSRTETVWNILRRHSVPTVIFINKLDRAGASYKYACEGISDLDGIDGKAVSFSSTSGDGCPDVSVKMIPDEEIAETVAMSDETAMELYLDGQLRNVLTATYLRKAISGFKIIPILAGCAKGGTGVEELIRFISEYMPYSGGDPNGEPAGVCYKVEHTPQGRLCHVRMFSGTLSNRDEIKVSGQPYKITQIRKITGNRASDIGTVTAGQIAALCGIGAKAGDIIGDHSLVPDYEELTEALMSTRITTPPDQFTRLTEAISELTEEDPVLKASWIREKQELTLSVTGKIQIEIIESILRTKYGLTPSFSVPSVIYRETIQSSGFGFDSYTMPKPCWAVLKFLMEPLPRGTGIEYSSIVENNKIFYHYQDQVKKTIPSALRQGPSGWPVTDIRITLVDGQHHTEHTHPLDFAVCTPMAIMNGLYTIGTVMLEPVCRFCLTVPEDSLGRILGEIVSRRGSYEITGAHKGKTRVEGFYPVSTTWDFPDYVSGATEGKGILTTSFEGFRDCPQEFCSPTEYRGISPLDRAKYILWVRKAITDESTYIEIT